MTIEKVDANTLEEKWTYKKDDLEKQKAEIELKITEEKKKIDERYAGQLQNINDKLELFK